MVGVLPQTEYLLVNERTVVGSFTNKYQIAVHLGFHMDDEGTIWRNNEPKGPKFLLRDEGPIANNHWKSKEDAMRDFAAYHMKLPRGYRIYRYLTNGY